MLNDLIEDKRTYATQLLEELLIDLQFEENYEKNVLLGRILIDYLHLSKMRANLTQMGQKLDIIIEKIKAEQ